MSHSHSLTGAECSGDDGDQRRELTMKIRIACNMSDSKAILLRI